MVWVFISFLCFGFVTSLGGSFEFGMMVTLGWVVLFVLIVA